MSRIWIFQAAKPFTIDEQIFIESSLKSAINQWDTHGKPLEASFEIKYNHFIIIYLDESKQGASGCSIDTMTRWIKKMEQDLNISLLNRMNIAYKEADFIKIISLSEFKKALKDNVLTAETVIFNNTITSLSEFQTQWEIPVKNSWANTLI